MEITLTLAGSIPVFHLSGRLDASTGPQLEERLKPVLEENERVSRIVFDCSDLTYVSSAGLRVFIFTQRQLSSRSGGAAFAALSNPVRDLFQLAGLEDLFIIEPSVAEAAARLGG